MSYINAIKRMNDVLVWERHGDQRKLVTYKAPFYFYAPAENGKYRSMYKEPLERHDYATGREFNEGRAQYSNFGVKLYESDIAPEVKILSEKYYGADLPKLHVTFFDIEVDYDEDVGYSSLEDPYAPINSIAYFNDWQNRMVVVAVPPPEYDGPTDEETILDLLNEITPIPTDCETEIHLFDNERDMLIFFMKDIEDSDVLSGWNSEGYDIPMLGKRLEKIGSSYFNQLSFPEANRPRWREDEEYGKTVIRLDISGRVSLDYQLIFKKFEVTERPSYTLEAISDEIIIDSKTKKPLLPKLEYEGTLASLYHNHFIKFLRYNFRDTEVLRGFEEILGYVELSNIFVHQSTGLFKHITGTIKLSEMSVLNHCHYDIGNVVVEDTHPPEHREKAKGAFVLLPQVDEHEWVGSIDLSSLYPSTIRSNNISPETVVGQFEENLRAFEEIRKRSYVQLTLKFDTGEELTATAEEWREALLAKQWGISGYGTVYSQVNEGIMPTILRGWYTTRKEYQAKMNEAKDKGDKAMALYYKKLQFVYKIKLNSFYGALLNPYFKFYDKRMGESTTATSREILLHQSAKVAELLDGTYTLPDRKVQDPKKGLEIGYSDKWSVVYGDTDSTYFKTYAINEEEAIAVADAVGERVNASFPEFMRDAFLCQPGFDDIMKTAREIVADRGIFVKKKKYLLHIINDDGRKVDYLKVMGLDTKKTALPKFIKERLNNLLEEYLTGTPWDEIAVKVVDFKDQIRAMDDLMLLGITKGIKNVEHYTGKYERQEPGMIPGHVYGAIFYNQCLEEYGDTINPRVTSGMKIKIFQLKKPLGKFKAISVPADLPKLPEWFLEHYGIDYDGQIERLVDNPLENIIGAIGKKAPTKQSLLVDDLLDF